MSLRPRAWIARLLAAAKPAAHKGRGLRMAGQVLGLKAAEETGGPAEMEVLIARAGYSRDGGWFIGEDVLAAAAPLFEAAQAFANHAMFGPPDIRCLTGWHRNIRMGEHEGARVLLSTFLISAAAKWLQDLAADALAAGIKEPFGFSFDIMARSHLEEQEGRGLVLVVDEILKVNSVDVVHRGRLGGMPLALAADDSPDKEIAMLKKLLAWLKEHAPERHKALGDKFTLEQVLQACEEAGFDPEKLQAQAKDDPAKSAPGIPGPAADPEPKKTEPLKAAAKPGEDDTRQRLLAMERGLTLERSLKGCTLPEPVKEKLQAQFTPERPWEEKDLTEAIRLEASALEKLTASGALKGFGARAEVTQDESDRIQAMLDGMIDPKAEIPKGVKPFRFLSEAWPAFTREPFEPRRVLAACRDYGMRASEDFGSVTRLRSALSVASWGQALGDSVTRALLRDFREDRFMDWRKIVSSVVPLKDFRTKRGVRLGGYGNLATVSEQATYPTLTSPGDEEATYAPAKRGGIEDLTLEMVQNDDIGSIMAIPKRLSRAAKRTLQAFVFNFLSGNGNIYDGVALFAAGHGGNTAANALTYANVIAGIKVMGGQTFFGEAAANTGPQALAKYLVHPTALLEEAFDITQSVVKVVTGADSTQASFINKNGVVPLWVPELTDANDWFLVAEPEKMDTIEIGFLDGQEEPELFVEDNPNAGSTFNADKLRYKIRHIYGGAVLDFRGFYRGAPA